MTINYSDLVKFVKAHASDPVELAKIITAWSWTSFSAFSYGVTPDPHNIKNLDTTLFGACGFRSLLFQELFSEIGVHTRQVSLFDIPVQGSHVATEIQVNGKWMYFDATFGIYFEFKSGGNPLSIEEVRADWPNVVLKQCTLDGWTGKRMDPNAIDAVDSFKTGKDFFFDHPGLNVTAPDISGELNTLIRGADVRYLENRVWSNLQDDTSMLTSVVRDTDNRHSWRTSEVIKASNGLKDFVFIEYDNNDAKYTDYDQSNSYSWQYVVTQTRGFFYKHQITTVYDDRTREIVTYDDRSVAAWQIQVRTYDRYKHLQELSLVYDDGSNFAAEYDSLNYSALATRELTFATDGTIASTRLVYDSGEIRSTNWSAQNTVAGSGTVFGGADADRLLGSASADILFGLAGADVMQGNGGNDIYYVDDPGDTVFEGKGWGIDTVNAAVSFKLPANVENLFLSGDAVRGTGNGLSNSIVGNAADNRLDGLGGNDNLVGAAGADFLVGGTGSDRLEGGPGADVLYGSAGADTFSYRSIDDTGAMSYNADLIKDFSPAAGDVIDLSMIDANVKLAGNQAFEFIGALQFSGPGQVRFLVGASEVRILLNMDGDSAPEAIIRLAGSAHPEADWFLL